MAIIIISKKHIDAVAVIFIRVDLKVSTIFMNQKKISKRSLFGRQFEKSFGHLRDPASPVLLTKPESRTCDNNSPHRSSSSSSASSCCLSVDEENASPLCVASPKYQPYLHHHQDRVTTNQKEVDDSQGPEIDVYLDELELPPEAPGYIQGIVGTLEIKKFGGSFGKRPRWKLRHVAFQAKDCLFIYSQSYVVLRPAFFFEKLT